MAYFIAAASSNGIEIDRHFGHAENFYIIQVSDAEYKLVEKRVFDSPCQHGFHDEQKLQATVEGLQDCRYVLAEAIGQGAEARLRASGIIPLEIEDTVTDAVEKVAAFDQLQQQYRLRQEG